ncbi:NUDIX domain-containing protein [Streptomyces sp. 7R007]
MRAVETVTDDWLTLAKYHLEVADSHGEPRQLTRLTAHRGDRAAVLLCSRRHGTVVLTSQLRLPVVLHGRPDGQLLEVPGGLLDEQDVSEAVRREAEEETGFRVAALRPVCCVYLAPQLSKERTYLFVADYDPHDRVGPGGGVAAEGEDLRVLEMTLEQALERVQRQQPADAKTLLLLWHARAQRLCG